MSATTAALGTLPSVPALVEGTVGHTRRTPLRHRFDYRVYQWLVDVDDLPRLRWPLRAFSTFSARDHLGDRTVNPCIAPVAGLIGSLTAFETIKFLSGAAAPVALGRKVTIDLQDLAVRATDGLRDADCPRCGDAVASRPPVGTEV